MSYGVIPRKMIRSNVSCRIVTVLAVILEISATKHWYVTENGRIQPQHDSVFDMRRPYDLLGFLEQEKRRETADAIYKKISRKEVSIDNQFVGLSMVDAENSNSDCFLWDKSLADVDVHASIMIDYKLKDGIDQTDYMLYNVVANSKPTVPDCQKTFPLDFSIYTFEHLKAMQNRKNLTQHEELSLMKYLPLNTDLNQFGHQLAYSLSRNNTSWIYLNLASIYWRIRGDAYNALECSRRAIVCASRQYRDIPLLTTAGILHAARYSGEAAIVLHAAIDYNPIESHHHLALGHIYTSLGDFDRSAACYDNCLKLAPDTLEAKQMKYAIFCHRFLETSLLLFDQRLRNVLSEIHAYHDWKEEWFKLYEHMLWEQNIKSATREIKLAFAREQNLHLLTINPIERSIHHIDNNVILSYMDLGDRKKIAENMLQNVHVSLHLLKNLQKQVKERSNRITKDIITELNMEYNNLFASPTRSPKYHNVEIKKGNEDFETDYWPKISDCDSSMLMFGDGKQYLPIYLSPENKGYATHLFVNELIDIEPWKKHPLPWHPPICQSPISFNERYITHMLLDATVQQHSPDISMKPFLHSLVHTADLAEIGQRILTATKAKVAAPWVLSMLASLHWRIVGKPRLALDCLQLALENVPKEFKDVPLVSIASIYHKVGLIDDALRLTDKALQINAVEDMLRTYTDSFDKIPDNQKESYYPSKDECDELKYEDWAASLFVFHKFIRRNVTIEDEIKSLDDDIPNLQPICNKSNSEMSRVTEVMQFSQLLQYKAELDMAEWLMMMTGMQNDTLQGLGTKIAFALQKHYASWTLAIAASFYWRVAGDSRKALDCMWQSLENTPKDMQDILLVNLASLLSSQNYFHEALEIAQIALSIGPDFIINHYVVANLHAALGDFETAASFYRSSLDLDPNFEPAITRLRVILCFLLFDDKKFAMIYRVGSAIVPSSELHAIVASSAMIPCVDKGNVHDCSVSWLSP
ncbi:Tetratricopeptide repeat protein 17 [Atta colombica]|uniref:Tetratricopeptide repeat protein 17 n=1 Tax=Atta colombica TaxID=520822 RepID=A0A195B9K8_9HYME|nr:Tetratricopeptide repeat protein 17 [Atta colombica]